MPLLWFSIAFVVGIIISGSLSLPWWLWIVVAILGVLFALAEHFFLRDRVRWQRFRSHIPLSSGILLFVFTLGGMRYLAGLPAISDSSLAYYNDRGTYIITARVSTPPDQREDSVYLELNALEIEDPLASDPSKASHTITGKARVHFPASTNWQLGDVLRFTAAPVTPSNEGSFSYKDYLARQQIATVMYFPRDVHLVSVKQSWTIRAWLETVRQGARKVIFSQYPQPESGLLAGILLGLDQDLPDSLVKVYQQTGTAHIIAISGFNMSMLAIAFSFLFSRLFNRYWTALLAGLGIVLYAIFVGGSPSVIRAAIMAVSAFGGHLIGRRQSGLNALGFTAALMCLFNPFLLGDVSFQLSFAATLGLVLFADPLQSWVVTHLASRMSEERAARISDPLGNYVLFTLAAQVTTLPVIVYQFGRVSVSSILANPLVLPVQPPLLIMGGLSTMTGAVSPELGRLFSLLVWPLAAYTNWVVELLARIKFGSLVIDSKLAAWILVFLVIFIVLFVFRNFFTKLFRGRFYWVLFVLILVCVVVWSILAHRPDGYLHVGLLRAGDESAIFIKTPEGNTLLFNPGKSTNELSAAISRSLSPWQFKIDQVWLSSRSAAGSLSELDQRIPVKSVVLPPVVYQAGADSKPLNIPPTLSVQKLREGELVQYSPALSIRVIAESNDSAAILVTYDAIKVLIPSGVDFSLIKATNPGALDGVSVLVLGDSDISYIPPRVWLSLDPQVLMWNSTSLSPVDTWLNTQDADNVSLISDGTGFTLEK